MLAKVEKFLQSYLKKDLPDIQPGYTVRVSQKVKEGSKERIQVFEGLVLALKHGKGINATITVRKVASGVGVERVFPIHAATIEKIEVTKKGKVRRAKLYYLREARGKRAKLKKIENLSVPGTAAKKVSAQVEAEPEGAKA
jgi:large subunit ribosomal protein L19